MLRRLCLAAVALAALLLHPGTDPTPTSTPTPTPAARRPSVVATAPLGRARQGFVGRWAHHPPPLVCLDVDADVLGVGVDLGLQLGGHRHDCPLPPTTTTTAPPPPPPTTTTTTTTAPPPSPPPPPPPAPAPPAPVAFVPPAPSPPPPPPPTTTTTTTTLPPPLPPEPSPPRLAVTAAFDPQRPVKGQLATVSVEVRNAGDGAAEDLVLTDDVSRTTELRSASSPDGDCTVALRTATCRLGRLGPGRLATVLVRVEVVQEPASSTLVQHISLSTGARAELAEQSFSALVDPGPSRDLALLDLPGPTVTVVALVTFVLAARAPAGNAIR